MKIIIDIPEKTWQRIKEGYVPLGMNKYLIKATPYPEGEISQLIAERDRLQRTLDAIDERDLVQITLNSIKEEIENDWQLKTYPSSPFSCGLRLALEIINKYLKGGD